MFFKLLHMLQFMFYPFFITQELAFCSIMQIDGFAQGKSNVINPQAPGCKVRLPRFFLYSYLTDIHVYTAFQAFIISSACCLLRGRRNILRITPFSSIRNVVLCNPIYFLPYNCFSPHTPYLSIIA